MENNQEKGLTLLEMIVVTAIIATLASILYLNFGNDSSYEANLTKARAFAVSIPLSLPVAFVSEWKFDGPTVAGSPATAADLRDTWSDNDGVSSTTPPIVREGRDCVSGKCLEFNGTNNYMETGTAGNAAVLNRAENWTLSVWVNPSEGVDNAIFSEGTPYSIFSLIVANSNDRVQINVWNVNRSPNWATLNSSAGVIKRGKWNHIALSFKGGESNPEFILYVNGEEQVLTGNHAMINHLSENTISAIGVVVHHPNYLNYFKGLMDHFQIYNEALSVSHIEKEYDIGLRNLYAGGVITAEEYFKRRG